MSRYADRPVIGISSCLLRQKVRHDGTAKRNRWLIDGLGGQVDYRPICPEVGIGLGTPRPPIRLVGTPEQARVVGVDDPTSDVTERLEDFALNTAGQLSGISGYVFMSKSPSCGMERVKLYADKGYATKKGVGACARVLMQALPNLPCEEEGRLNDPMLRENFINRVFVYRRWQTLRHAGLSARALTDFHARHKYMLMTDSQAACQRMGRLLSQLKGVDLEQVADAYEAEMMTGLKPCAGRKRHVNALRHIQGYLKRPDRRRRQTGAVGEHRGLSPGGDPLDRADQTPRALLPAPPRPVHHAAVVSRPLPGVVAPARHDLRCRTR